MTVTKDATLSIRVDAQVKRESEDVLKELGLSITAAVNMLLRQIARERAVPLSLTLSNGSNTYEDLLFAQAERNNGLVGRRAQDVIEDMQQIVFEAEHGKA